tara:strand:+ start:27985 stop:28506 length:522 start_codon:yes stop_codon:yes gene_type:complete
MNSETVTYPAVNQKSIYILFLLIIVLGITCFATWFGYVLLRDGYILHSLITLPFILIFPICIIHMTGSKIILTSDSVIRKTLFGKKMIKYKDIKTLKRFEQFGGGSGPSTLIETDEIQSNSKDILSVKQIFISNKEGANPKKMEKDKRLIFNETYDIYNRLKEKITSANTVYN